MRIVTRAIPSATAIGVLVVGVMLTGCGVQVPADPPAPVELRAYQVPPEYQEELRGMLQGAMILGEDEVLGRVTNGPGGTLVVAAPGRIQDGIEQILGSGFEAPAIPTPVRLTYWFLAGRALDPGQATGSCRSRDWCRVLGA